MNEKNQGMSLVEHLNELRRYLMVSAIAVLLCSGLCFALYDRFFYIFYKPFSALQDRTGEQLFINYIYEGFLIKLKLSIIAGIVVSFPVHAYSLLRFIFPGLTTKEKRILGISLASSFLLAGGGFYYGYFYIIPLSIDFLTGTRFIPEGVGMLLSFDRNILYVLQFLAIAVLLFQLPIILEILMVLNIVSRKALFQASRYIILVTFLIAALFTPPDFVSQIAVAVPLIFLFYLTLLVAKIAGFGKGA